MSTELDILYIHEPGFVKIIDGPSVFRGGEHEETFNPVVADR